MWLGCKRDLIHSFVENNKKKPHIKVGVAGVVKEQWPVNDQSFVISHLFRNLKFKNIFCCNNM